MRILSFTSFKGSSIIHEFFTPKAGIPAVRPADIATLPAAGAWNIRTNQYFREALL
jgi:hypothetical protein